MTYDFFREYYDIKEYELKNIYVKSKVLHIDVVMPIHLELIANGYRPELDMTQEKSFLFNVESIDKEYPMDIAIEFKEKVIEINKDSLVLNDFKVDIA